MLETLKNLAISKKPATAADLRSALAEIDESMLSATVEAAETELREAAAFARR